MLIQRVALLSVVDLGRESVQGGPLCLPLSFLITGHGGIMDRAIDLLCPMPCDDVHTFEL